MDGYKVLISLEMHCEFSETNSKVFSSAKNDFSDIPNASVSPVDMAFPGTLPVLNKKAVEHALKLSMILGCKQPEYMYFERKNYYYPDLPKGYQITQAKTPIGYDGFIEIIDEGIVKKRTILFLVFIGSLIIGLVIYFITSNNSLNTNIPPSVDTPIEEENDKIDESGIYGKFIITTLLLQALLVLELLKHDS